jgi:uncharacterized membrane protein YwaF
MTIVLAAVVFAVLAGAYVLQMRRDFAGTAGTGEILINLLLAGVIIALAALTLTVSLVHLLDDAVPERLQRLVIWVPRGAALLFVAFLAALSFDVFEHGYTAGQLVAALLLHLTPAFVLMGAMLLAWRWEWVGALIFGGWAMLWTVLGPGGPPSARVLIVGLPLILAVLFMFGWHQRSTTHGGAGAHATGPLHEEES